MTMIVVNARGARNGIAIAEMMFLLHPSPNYMMTIDAGRKTRTSIRRAVSSVSSEAAARTRMTVIEIAGNPTHPITKAKIESISTGSGQVVQV
jgi:hypothetical protein